MVIITGPPDRRRMIFRRFNHGRAIFARGDGLARVVKARLAQNSLAAGRGALSTFSWRLGKIGLASAHFSSASINPASIPPLRPA